MGGWVGGPRGAEAQVTPGTQNSEGLVREGGVSLDVRGTDGAVWLDPEEQAAPWRTRVRGSESSSVGTTGPGEDRGCGVTGVTGERHVGTVPFHRVGEVVAQ